MNRVDPIDFYRTPGARTVLPALSDRAGELRHEPEDIYRTVRGLVIHEGAIRYRGLAPEPGQLAGNEAGAGQILDQALQLDPGPLGDARPVRRRVVGQCYHITVLHTALLRGCGTPARARCGFASYFEPEKWIDHWVTERWDAGRWIAEDADAGRLELSPADFRPAGAAWLACRRDGEDPGGYGNRMEWGWPELRGSLLSDAAALLKNEQFMWNGWELATEPPIADPEEEAWLDRLAELTLDDALLPELAARIEANPRFSRGRRPA